MRTAVNTKIRNFRDLEVWQKAMTLAELCYAIVEILPASESFALALQIRRASVSVPSNIAEGHQLSQAGYRHHVSLALGSLAELDTQIELAIRVGLLSDQQTRGLVETILHVRQMLRRLRSALSTS
jgi:four helix bundle protein